MAAAKPQPFSATWLHVSAEGVERRIEVRSADRSVRVDSTGNPAGAPRATEIGTWQGAASADALASLEKALEKVAFPGAALPKLNAPGTSLWVAGAKTAGAIAVQGEQATVLGKLFDAVAATAKPAATLSMELHVTPGDEWSWSLRLKAGGTHPLVTAHPARAASEGLLVASRGGSESPVAVGEGPAWVVVDPAKPLVVSWKSAPLGGDGPVELWWTVPKPRVDASFGVLPAPEGVFASNPVKV